MYGRPGITNSRVPLIASRTPDGGELLQPKRGFDNRGSDTNCGVGTIFCDVIVNGG